MCFFEIEYCAKNNNHSSTHVVFSIVERLATHRSNNLQFWPLDKNRCSV